MTDLDRFIALYASLGIQCIISTHDQGHQIILSAEDYSPDTERTYSEKFNGYHGFYTCVVFDHDGRFVSQGFWE